MFVNTGKGIFTVHMDDEEKSGGTAKLNRISTEWMGKKYDTFNYLQLDGVYKYKIDICEVGLQPICTRTYLGFIIFLLAPLRNVCDMAKCSSELTVFIWSCIVEIAL